MRLLMIPYKHPDQMVRKARITALSDLIRGGLGYTEFIIPNLDQHFYTELGMDYPLILLKNLTRFTSKIQIYPLPGWQSDPLILEVLGIAKVLNIPVEYIPIQNWHMEGQYLYTWKQARLM